MKKTLILSIAALVAMGSIINGCSKEENPQPEKNVVTLTASISLNGNTKTKALTGSGVKTFAEGEQMAVVYKNTGGSTVKAVSAALKDDGDITNAGKSAKFSVTLEDPDMTQDVTYIYPAAMANADGTVNYDALANQDGTLATLSSNLDFCTLTAAWDGTSLPNGTLENQFAICAFTLKNSDGSSEITNTIIGLTISDGTNDYTVSRSAVDGPIYVAMLPTDNANIFITAYSSSNYYSKSLTSKTYEASNGYNISLRMTDINVLTGSSITPSTSSKWALESVIKFTFKKGNDPVSNIRFVRVFSGNNMLMASFNEGTSTDTPNPVTVSQTTDLPDDLYIGLRFTPTANDPIIFQLFDQNGKAYSGSITAPAEGLENGKFYDLTVPVHLDEFTANADGKRVCFSPGDFGANNTFSEPFVGIGNTSYYFNESTCTANKTVAGVAWRIPEDGIGDWEMWYIVGGLHGNRTMTGNASRYYRVYIDKSVTINSETTDPTCCLLIPPDDANLTDAEKTELSNAASSSKPLSDYLKYIGKGFVLLTRTCYYDSSWKTVAAPTIGVYRTRQSKRCFKFDTGVTPTEIQGNNSQTSKTSTLTRVRYIHTTYTP